MTEFSKGHALLIGVGEYQDKNWSVPVTASDAQSVFEVITPPDISSYPKGQISTLKNEGATKQGIITALQDLGNEAQPADTVFIFFCGHGLLGTDGLYYFATHDTIFTPQEMVEAGSGLSSPELVKLLRNIKSQKFLFIINACFSGYVSPSLGPAPGSLGSPPSASFGPEILATGEGRAIITASRSTQVSSYLRDQPHTFFGQALIEGLKGRAAVSTSSYIGLYELYQYIYTEVKAQAKTIDTIQEPVLTIMQGVGPFPVAFNPVATSLGHGSSDLQQKPPHDMAVETVPKTLIQMINKGPQATGQASVAFNNLIDFGKNNKIGNINTGDIAGRDIIKINITPANVVSADNKSAILNLIKGIESELEKLSDLSDDDRDDIGSDLSKAYKAGKEDKKDRLLEKLESAQKNALKVSGATREALKLAETIGTVLQRAWSLW